MTKKIKPNCEKEGKLPRNDGEEPTAEVAKEDRCDVLCFPDDLFIHVSR
jgi:hypothetical protein